MCVCVCVYRCTANPIWSDISESSFKAQSSKLERLFSLKRGKRDVRALRFETAFENVTPNGIGCSYMYSCMCVYVCVYTYVYYMYSYMCVYVCVYTYVYYMYVYTGRVWMLYVTVQVQVAVHVCVCVCVNVCVCV